MSKAQAQQAPPKKKQDRSNSSFQHRSNKHSHSEPNRRPDRRTPSASISSSAPAPPPKRTAWGIKPSQPPLNSVTILPRGKPVPAPAPTHATPTPKQQSRSLLPATSTWGKKTTLAPAKPEIPPVSAPVQKTKAKQPKPKQKKKSVRGTTNLCFLCCCLKSFVDVCCECLFVVFLFRGCS
eukprot:m.55947 g.55947  ORF g.55947 m.55947 type:complete len:180 (-) comp18692_c0_seq2:15-554(-)